ncbi:MAG: T9SS type A sorting domain-containing protein [Bacteroidota bacterium]
MKPHILKIAVIAFLFCLLKASAQEQKMPVGTQPAEIIRMGDDLHVFCSGADMNGNGIVEKDSGDVEASWWIFDAATMNVKKSKVLDSSFLKEAPLNLTLASVSAYVFHGKNQIKRYDRFSQELFNNIDIPDSLKNIVMLNYAPLPVNRLHIVSKYKDIFYETYIGVYIETPSIIPFKNPVQFFFNENDEYPDGFVWDFPIILTKGTKGSKNSVIIRPFAGNGEYSTVLGEGANFMYRKNDSIYITMYDEHSVKIVHKYKGDILKTIPTQTTGSKGPRECAIDGDNLYVTTYNCDIRKFSISTGELLKIIPISGMADPIQIVNGKLIVGVTRTCDSLPNNSISVIDITTSVENEEPFAISASVSPNPFKNSASISATFPSHVHSATIEIFTTSGNSVGVFKKEVINGEVNFHIESDVLKLSQGQYMARISAGKQMSVVPFVIVK